MEIMFENHTANLFLFTSNRNIEEAMAFKKEISASIDSIKMISQTAEWSLLMTFGFWQGKRKEGKLFGADSANPMHSSGPLVKVLYLIWFRSLNQFKATWNCHQEGPALECSSCWYSISSTKCTSKIMTRASKWELVSVQSWLQCASIYTLKVCFKLVLIRLIVLKLLRQKNLFILKIIGNVQQTWHFCCKAGGVFYFFPVSVVQKI